MGMNGSTQLSINSRPRTASKDSPKSHPYVKNFDIRHSFYFVLTPMHACGGHTRSMKISVQKNSCDRHSGESRNPGQFELPGSRIESGMTPKNKYSKLVLNFIFVLKVSCYNCSIKPIISRTA